MPNTLKLKSSTTAGAAPSSLVAGEVALNRQDGLLYYSTPANAIAAIGDVVDGGVVSPANLLVLNFDGTIADSSTYARSVSAAGNATTSTAQKRFGTRSAIFDGSGDRIDVSSSADFNIGASDHTVEFWMWVNSTTPATNERLLVFEGTTQTRGIVIDNTNKTAIGVNLFGTGWQILSAAGAFSLQTWTHVALVRSGTTTTLYCNGVSVGSTTAQCLPTTASSVSIGGNIVRFADSNFNGYIDAVRVANSALYSGATITPPTTAPTQFVGSSARSQSIRLRGGTAATLSATNPTPAVREPVYETDTRCLKISGDGTTAYNALGYVRQYVTATDRLLGRSSAGPGVAEEVTCTADARAILGASNVYACRAWAQIAGNSNSTNLSGTYSQSGGTALTVVSAVAHGLQVGQSVYLDFTSGTAVDGTFTVATVANASTFTVTATAATTSGNVTLTRNQIRGSGNVSSVADLGVGTLGISFVTAMTDANYSVVGCVDSTSGSGIWTFNVMSTVATTGFQAMTRYTPTSAAAPADFSQVFIAVFR